MREVLDVVSFTALESLHMRVATNLHHVNDGTCLAAAYLRGS